MISRNPDMLKVASTCAGPSRLPAMQNPLDAALYHPLAARLARKLASTPVTPNMVSVAGGATVVLAGFVYSQPESAISAPTGLALHMAWHVLDGADGDLARLTGRSSPVGEIIDGLADYTGHIVLYLLLAAAAFPEFGWLAWMLAVPAGISRILQANFYEAQRRQFLFWVHGVPWLRSPPAEAGPFRLAMFGKAYLALADRLAPGDPRIDRALANPLQAMNVHERLRALGPRALAGSDLLGANYRTLALGASMFAGTPLWYFLYELTVLNLVLAHAVWQSRQRLSAVLVER